MSVFSSKKVQEALEKEVVRKHTILIVDDEESNLKALEALLSRHYRVLKANNGKQALELVESMDNPDEIHLIISDQRMPGLSGVAFFHKVAQIVPKTIRILLTAFKDVTVILDSINRAQIYKYILKPYDRDDLLITVKRALELYDAQLELDDYRESLERQVEQRTKALLQQARYAALGTMILGMTERLTSPLTFINGLTAVTSELITDLESELGEQKEKESIHHIVKDVRENLEVIEKNGKLLNNFVEGMMLLSREEMPRVMTLDLNNLLEENADLASHRIHALDAKFSVTVETQFDAAVKSLETSPQYLSRVLNAIFNNAAEALYLKLGKDKLFEPRLLISTKCVGDSVEVVIRDNGVGIQEENLDRVFDHFFTTKSSEQGHVGLGLSMARDFIKEQGGAIHVTSQIGEYTEVRFTLPQ